MKLRNILLAGYYSRSSVYPLCMQTPFGLHGSLYPQRWRARWRTNPFIWMACYASLHLPQDWDSVLTNSWLMSSCEGEPKKEDWLILDVILKKICWLTLVFILFRGRRWTDFCCVCLSLLSRFPSRCMWISLISLSALYIWVYATKRTGSICEPVCSFACLFILDCCSVK